MKNFKPGDLGEGKCYSMNDTDMFKEIKIQSAPNKSRTNDLWISLPLRYTTEQWETRCKMGRRLIRFMMTNFPPTASIGMSICGAQCNNDTNEEGNIEAWKSELKKLLFSE